MQKGSLFSQPFPRDRSRKVTTPAWNGEPPEDARAAWFTWLRIAGNLRQFTIPPLHRPKDEGHKHRR